MILFFDVETNGLPDFNKRARDPSQPHIVQLAAMLTEDNGDLLESHNVIVKPDGWEITKELSDIHGITNDLAKRAGIAEEMAIQILWSMIARASLIVAHNLQFDKFLARIAARRFEILKDEDDAMWKALPGFCTMRKMTEVCQLPGRFPGQYKFPKLSEAYEHIFGKPLAGAHDALVDVKACRDIYFWLGSQPKQQGELV